MSLKSRSPLSAAAGLLDVVAFRGMFFMLSFRIWCSFMLSAVRKMATVASCDVCRPNAQSVLKEENQNTH